MWMVRGLGDQDLIIRRKDKGIPNDVDKFKSELGTNVRGHYNRKEELMNHEGAPEIKRDRRLEAAREKQNHEVDLMLSETLI